MRSRISLMHILRAMIHRNISRNISSGKYITKLLQKTENYITSVHASWWQCGLDESSQTIVLYTLCDSYDGDWRHSLRMVRGVGFVLQRCKAKFGGISFISILFSVVNIIRGGTCYGPHMRSEVSFVAFTLSFCLHWFWSRDQTRETSVFPMIPSCLPQVWTLKTSEYKRYHWEQTQN